MRSVLLLLAGGLLVIAGIGIAVLRLSSDPTCPSGADAPEPVLVARQLIPAATPGSVIVSRRLYAAAVVRCSERKPGALADSEQLLDKVTVVDLFPGQQLTEADLPVRPPKRAPAGAVRSLGAAHRSSQGPSRPSTAGEPRRGRG